MWSWRRSVSSTLPSTTSAPRAVPQNTLLIEPMRRSSSRRVPYPCRRRFRQTRRRPSPVPYRAEDEARHLGARREHECSVNSVASISSLPERTPAPQRPRRHRRPTAKRCEEALWSLAWLGLPDVRGDGSGSDLPYMPTRDHVAGWVREVGPRVRTSSLGRADSRLGACGLRLRREPSAHLGEYGSRYRIRSRLLSLPTRSSRFGTTMWYLRRTRSRSAPPPILAGRPYSRI